MAHWRVCIFRQRLVLQNNTNITMSSQNFSFKATEKYVLLTEIDLVKQFSSYTFTIIVLSITKAMALLKHCSTSNKMVLTTTC